MSKVIPNEERISKAHALIEKARNIPHPTEHGWDDLSYAAQVKDTLRQAKDMIKFLPMTSGVPVDLKKEAAELIASLPTIEKEILHRA
jgi:hypothetical protein